jgi:hypothetical protein
MLILPPGVVTTRQPSQPTTIDYGNPLTRGLTDVILPHLMRSMIIGVPQNNSASTNTFNAGQAGVARRSLDVASVVDTYAISQAYSVPMTMLAIYERTRTTTGPTRVSGTYDVSVSGFGIISNNTNVRAGFARAGGNEQLTGGAHTVGKVNVIAYVLDGSTANVTHTLYEDGVQTATAASTGAIVLGTNDFMIGRCPDATGWGARHYLYAFWDRVLTPAEVRQISRNPWQIFANSGRRSRVAFDGGGGDLVLPLTGVSATGAVGSVRPSLSAVLTGTANTGSVGSVTPSSGAAVALTGVSATGAPGTLTPATSSALTGVGATGAVGDVTYSAGVSVALSGVSATGVVGTPAPVLSAALSGASALGAVGDVEPLIAVALTGVASTGEVGSVSYDSGTVAALTGVAAAGQVGSVAPQIIVPLTGVFATGAVGTVSPIESSLYPDPSDVRFGVTYGPGGIYVGTLVVGTGDSVQNIRSFTERF